MAGLPVSDAELSVLEEPGPEPEQLPSAAPIEPEQSPSTDDILRAVNQTEEPEPEPEPLPAAPEVEQSTDEILAAVNSRDGSAPAPEPQPVAAAAAPAADEQSADDILRAVRDITEPLPPEVEQSAGGIPRAASRQGLEEPEPEPEPLPPGALEPELEQLLPLSVANAPGPEGRPAETAFDLLQAKIRQVKAGLVATKTTADHAAALDGEGVTATADLSAIIGGNYTSSPSFACLWFLAFFLTDCLWLQAAAAAMRRATPRVAVDRSMQAC